ncbi:hypothetical protein DS745_13375 [Anaerobacillus alkaliphilus]|uniref:Uncharacterized protein n=1 Tax=Anaerobacillus alkaliphilus TaxID=1548597 RepID=A0A4Q0VRW5_9BACI|nr:hypothetical protein [Anaerobacillus alkaliphilus]RXI99865.1 hypothetical protein DS745_13375 [Anaerobacillus alkaliphilus]
MSICPLCNGIESMSINCDQCNLPMEDKGRIMDYFDDYSAYLDIDGMKLFNGIADDARNKQCPHVFYCSQCHTEKTMFIQEIEEAH